MRKTRQRTDPDATLPVERDGAGVVAHEPIALTAAAERTLLTNAETTGRRDEHPPAGILGHVEHGVRRESVVLRVRAELTAIESTQATVRGEPHVAESVLIHPHHLRLRKSFGRSVLAKVERLRGGRRRGNDSGSRGDRDDEREAA